jgi:hypothetical protein
VRSSDGNGATWTSSAADYRSPAPCKTVKVS